MAKYPSDPKSVLEISSEKERDSCWERVRQFMDDRGLDGLLVFGSDKLGLDHYLTNDRPGQHVLFPRHGKMVSMAFSAQVPAKRS